MRAIGDGGSPFRTPLVNVGTVVVIAVAAEVAAGCAQAERLREQVRDFEISLVQPVRGVVAGFGVEPNDPVLRPHEGISVSIPVETGLGPHPRTVTELPLLDPRILRVDAIQDHDLPAHEADQVGGLSEAPALQVAHLHALTAELIRGVVIEIEALREHPAVRVDAAGRLAKSDQEALAPDAVDEAAVGGSRLDAEGKRVEGLLRLLERIAIEDAEVEH